MSTAADTEKLFPYDRWEPLLTELASRYREADPYPHIALEDFLDEAVVRAVAAEFPAPDSTTWIHYKHFNENKVGKTRRDEFPPLIGRLVDELSSPRFVRWLSGLTGIENLMPDGQLEGGGLHQSSTGGFLNMHADFTMHHHKPDWRRRCNLILYLNEGWKEEWRGALELWDRDMKACRREIPPLLNRAVVFSTTEDSYHGFPDPLRCPEGVHRRSIALYYYTQEKDPSYKGKSTDYRARPQDGLKAIPIWLDKTAVALFSKLKSKLGLSDQLASRILKLISRR